MPTAYAAEKEEDRTKETLDALDDESTTVRLPQRIEEAPLRDEEMLDGMPLPGAPGAEKARREAWLKAPRRARAAIRKMHREW